MKRLSFVLILFFLLSFSSARVVFEDDFNYLVVEGDAGANQLNSPFIDNGPWTRVKSWEFESGAGGFVYTVDPATIPESGGVNPSATSEYVLAMDARPVELGRQTDFYLGREIDGQDDLVLPADSWVQFWVYFGTDEDGNIADGKILYPCRDGHGSCHTHGWIMVAGDYSNNPTCEHIGVSEGVFFVVKGNSFTDENGDFYEMSSSDNCDGGSHEFGTSAVNDYFRPNTWYLAKYNFDTSTSSGGTEGWIKEYGTDNWVKVMDWVDGVTPGFTWQIEPYRQRGHDYFRLGTTKDDYDSVIYFSDFVVATSEDDLPTYGASAQCSDGFDNDGDGEVDMSDSGCSFSGDNDESDCGDGSCEGGERCFSCSVDCGSCPAACGDGNLDSGEECDDGDTVQANCEYGVSSCVVCSSDCLNVAGEVSYCGDLVCDFEEDCGSCVEDCPVCSVFGEVFFDDFSQDSLSGYSSGFLEGGASTFSWENERMNFLTGNDEGIIVSHYFDVVQDGEFGLDFFGSEGYPSHARVVVRLKQDDYNYYSLSYRTNEDGISLSKYVDGVEVGRDSFANYLGYNELHDISMGFEDGILSGGVDDVSLFVEDSVVLDVDEIEVEFYQLDGYIDNINLSVSGLDVGAGCAGFADLEPCDGVVDLDEVSLQVQAWMRGEIELADLIDVINSWV